MFEERAWPLSVELIEYLPILVFLCVALLISTSLIFAPMVVSRFTKVHKPNPDKLAEYECGFPAFEAPRSQFNIRFYLVAILFLIFDLEVAFLFPWAVVVFELGWEAWWAIMIFLAILIVGFVYEWKMGALDWE